MLQYRFIYRSIQSISAVPTKYMPCVVYQFVSQYCEQSGRGIRTGRGKEKRGKKMCPEVVNLRKTKTLKAGKGPPLAPILETEIGHEDLPGIYISR